MALIALLVLLSGLIAGHGTFASRDVGMENSLSEQKELNSDFKEQLLELKQDYDSVKTMMLARLSDLQEQVHENEERNMYLQKKIELLTKKLILVSRSKHAKQPIWQNQDDNKDGGDESNTVQGKPNKPNSYIRQGHTLLKDISNGTVGPGHNIQARQVTGSVAFSTFVKTDITGLTQGEVVKYEGVMVNYGNAYDPTTGIFTAPRDGLYLFSFFVEDYTDQDLWVELRQDNHIRSAAVAEPYGSNQNIMGGNVVLLPVTTGSRIWIAIERGTRVQSNLSTFSGIFLH